METHRAAFDTAFKKWEGMRALCYSYMRSGGGDSGIASEIARSVPPGLYEHWKSVEGNLKFYVVFGAGVEQDVHIAFVSYAALYPPHHGVLTSRNLVHEQYGFLTPIDRKVYHGPRFRLVTELRLREIATVLECVGELAVIDDPMEFRLRIGELLKKDIPHF